MAKEFVMIPPSIDGKPLRREVQKAVNLFNQNKVESQLSSDHGFIIVYLDDIVYKYFVDTGRWNRVNSYDVSKAICGRYVSIFPSIKVDKEWLNKKPVKKTFLDIFRGNK